MAFAQEERPLAIPDLRVAPRADGRGREIVERCRRTLCDINMGCRRTRCSRLLGRRFMGDPRARRDDASGSAAAPDQSADVKFRAGLDHNRENYLDLGRICEANGVQAITLHARNRAQMFRGQADWSRIRRLKESVSIPSSATETSRPRGRAEAHEGDRVRRGDDRTGFLEEPLDLPADGRTAREPPREGGDERHAAPSSSCVTSRRSGGRRAATRSTSCTRSGRSRLVHPRLADGRLLRQKINDIRTPEEFFLEIERFFALHAAA